MTGTIDSRIKSRLGDYPPYREFLAGRLPRREYVAAVNGRPPGSHEREFGLNEDQFHLSGRRPDDEVGFVDGILADLAARGVLPGTAYDKAAFAEFRRRVAEEYRHGDRSTYIFPEEERLAWALASLLKPRSLGYFGSYYGYWAVWTLPHLRDAGGSAVYLDTDPEVCATARENLSRLGFAGCVEVRCEDAVAFLRSDPRRYDLALIDAEGPSVHPDPDYAKKRIYYPIFRELIPRLVPRGVAAAHNILLKNSHPDRYFERKIPENLSQFDKLLPLVRERFDVFEHYETSEGVGIFRLGAG